MEPSKFDYLEQLASEDKRPKIDPRTYHSVLEVFDSIAAYVHVVLFIIFGVYILVAIALKTHLTTF